MARTYLIRYGMAGQVGRFSAAPEMGFERGERVVVRSHRGTELGEVLIEAPSQTAEGPGAYVLRAASPEDLERGRRAGRDRDARFAACLGVFADGVWPFDVIDVEPLLDDGRTVIHYLGPHRLDIDGVLAAFRSRCDLDVMFQPAGRDLPDDDPELDAGPESDEPEHGCGSCGTSGGCGTGGGGGCGTSSGGCGDCGVKKLISARR